MPGAGSRAYAVAAPSQRNVSVLLRGIAVALALEGLQRVNEPRSGVAGVDDVVEVATSGRNVGVGELLAIILDPPVGRAGRVVALSDLLAVQDFDGALGAHDGDLRRRPRNVEVSANVLGAHHVVRTA